MVQSKRHPILAVLTIIGFYLSLDVALPIGGLLPNVIGGGLGILLLSLHLPRIDLRFVFSVIILALLYAINCLAAAIFVDSEVLIFLPVAQLIYSLVTAYGLYLELIQWKRSDLSKVFGALSAVILVGAALEVYTPFKAFAVMIGKMHTLAHPMRSELAFDFRDLGMYGRVRPRLFTEESSFVGINFGLFSGLWVMAAERLDRRLIIRASIVFLLGLLIIRSPFVALAILLPAVDIIFNRERTSKRMRFEALELALFVIASVFVIGYGSILFGQLFGQRIARAQVGNDWSVTVRTYGAVIAGWRVALEYPFFGVGAGNFEGIRPTQLQTYARLSVPDYALTPTVLRATLNNGLATMLAFFGFFGSIFYILAWRKIAGSLSPKFSIFSAFGVIFLIYTTSGGIYSPKAVWPILMVLAVTVAPASRTASEFASGKAVPAM